MTSTIQIFVVHGALGSAGQLEPVALALGEIGTVHNVELPGHGDTPLPDGSSFSMQAIVDALRDVVLEVPVTSAQNDLTALPIVFGYSMGGYAALALEAQRPGTFGAIVTLGTKFAWSPELASRELRRLDANFILEKIPKFAKTLEVRHVGSGGWKLLLERTGALLTQLGDTPLLTWETMPMICSRVCMAVGELDDTVSADEAAEYATYIPGGVSRLVAGAPHPIERVSVSDIVTLVRETIQQ